MAQLVGPPTLAQVMISQLVGWSPTLGSELTEQSLLGIFSLSLSLCPSPTHAVSVPLKNKLKKILK